MSSIPSPSNSVVENSGELVLDLLNNFLNLNINEEISVRNINSVLNNNKNNQLENNTMAPPAFETKLLTIVPTFDGNPLELSCFLDTAGMLINSYYDNVNLRCPQNILILYSIFAKLTGTAKEVYSTCITKDWPTVKGALIAYFGDHRNESGLLSDLGFLKQNNFNKKYYQILMLYIIISILTKMTQILK